MSHFKLSVAVLAARFRCCSTCQEAVQRWLAAAVRAGLNQPGFSIWDRSEWVFRRSGCCTTGGHPQYVRPHSTLKRNRIQGASWVWKCCQPRQCGDYGRTSSRVRDYFVPCDATTASIDFSLSGQITYTWTSTQCDLKEQFSSPDITLKSAAFSGCTLTAGPSTFPTGQTVTGTLTADTVRLTAAALTSNAASPVKTVSATWQLSDCPLVRPNIRPQA